LQRMFSTFADGWPGNGLLLLRLVTGAALIHEGMADSRVAFDFASIASQVIEAGAGVLLVAGLWTPVAGVVLAVVELWVAFSHVGGAWIPIILATLGAALAMVGPGAWSIDARLFGRKHLEIPEL
jgi:putative oxidoreductase